VIAVLLAVGLAAALSSLWFHRQGGRRALEFWGPQTAALIAWAPNVEALQLSPAQGAGGDGNETGHVPPASDQPIRRIGVGGTFYSVSRDRVVSSAPGVSNVRRAMVLDPPYAWEQTGVAVPNWQFALEFRDGERTAMALFDFDSRQMGSAAGGATVVMRPEAAADWASFFAEQFAERSAE
jgi:hypothetical protein